LLNLKLKRTIVKFVKFIILDISAGEIPELLTKEEQIPNTQVYDNLHTKVELIRETVQKWMNDACRRINKERKSIKSSLRTKSSKASHASECVSYLRNEGKERTVSCSFIMAKSRTAPLQHLSVLRLRLQAATIDLKISLTFF